MEFGQAGRGRGGAWQRCVVGALFWVGGWAYAANLVHLDHNSVLSDHATLQAAIDAATDGDTIRIDAGELKEQVIITKALTIEGAGMDSTFLRAPDAGDLVQSRSGGVGWTNLKGQDVWALVGIKLANAGRVQIKKLTVDGRDLGELTDPRYLQDKNLYDYSGIAVFGSNVLIDSVKVTGVRALGPLTPPQLQALYPDEPWGMNINSSIFAESAAGAGSHTLEVANSTIVKFQKSALLAWGPTLVVDIHDNLFQGYGQTLHSSGNGIQLASSDLSGTAGKGDRRGSTGAIYNNRLLGFGHVIPTDGNPGAYLNMGQGGPTAIMLVEAGNGVEVRDNLITGPSFNNWYNSITSNDGGYQNTGISVASTANAVVRGNTITGMDIAVVESGAPAGSRLSITGNTVQGNGIDYWAGAGDDPITLGSGAEIVAFGQTDNGSDLITGFGIGDRLQVIGFVDHSVNGNTGSTAATTMQETEGSPVVTSYLDAHPVVDFTGGSVTVGDGSSVAARSVQLSYVNGVTTLFIDTNNAAGPPELTVRLAGQYEVANFALSGGFIRYVPLYTLSGAASPVAGGTVQCNPTRVPEGGSATCTASASTGYKFLRWSGACSGSVCAPSNIQSDLVATAVFAPLTVDANPGGGGGGGAGVGTSVRADLVDNSCSGFETYTFEPATGRAPNGDPYAYSKFSFTTSCASATVKLTFPSLDKRSKFWKYYGGQWHDWSSRVSFNFSERSVTFVVTDNGEGDDNPAPGIISDPVALSQTSISELVASVPTLSEWGRGLLMLATACAGALMLRRRRA